MLISELNIKAVYNRGDLTYYLVGVSGAGKTCDRRLYGRADAGTQNHIHRHLFL